MKPLFSVSCICSTNYIIWVRYLISLSHCFLTGKKDIISISLIIPSSYLTRMTSGSKWGSLCKPYALSVLLPLPLKIIMTLGVYLSFFKCNIKSKETKGLSIKYISPKGFPFFKAEWKSKNLTVLINCTKALPSAGHGDGMLAMVTENEISNHQAFSCNF